MGWIKLCPTVVFLDVSDLHHVYFIVLTSFLLRCTTSCPTESANALSNYFQMDARASLVLSHPVIQTNFLNRHLLIEISHRIWKVFIPRFRFLLPEMRDVSEISVRTITMLHQQLLRHNMVVLLGIYSWMINK